MKKILSCVAFSLIFASTYSQTFNSETMSERKSDDFLVKTTCGDTVSCLSKQFGDDPTTAITKCASKISDCDAVCLAGIASFQTCTQRCRGCATLQDEFPWSCLDDCEKATGSKPVVQLIDCIYGPCKPSSSSVFIIILVVVLGVAIIAGAAFGIYKYKQSKSPSLDTSRGDNFNKITA